MAAASQSLVAPRPANPNKRKNPPTGGGRGRGSNKRKLIRSDEPARRRHKPSDKFQKLLRKRARDYNSDDDDEDDQRKPQPQPQPQRDADDDDERMSEEASSSGDESTGGVTRFEQGCRAFRVAFTKIMTKKIADNPLGPILSSHKKLVAAKLAEEADDHKPKGEGRKEKRLAAEKGHVIPAGLLDKKEKDLIKVATQGVVRLFNAVSKAQNPRKGLNPSRSKDAKALAKERKHTFLTELKKSSNQDQKGKGSSNISKHTGNDEDEPGWAPLRDTYMLGSKLKDWDKTQASDVANEPAEVHLDDDSSDEE